MATCYTMDRVPPRWIVNFQVNLGELPAGIFDLSEY